MEREFTEWTNSWRDDANHPKKRRWLLIGDSVHRDQRGPLQNILKPFDISLDFYAASFHIEDEAFRREIENFFSFDEYEYEIALIGWGGHHGYARKTSQDSEVRVAYKRSFEEALKYVMDRCRMAVILSSTPVVTAGKLDVLCADRNPEVVERNHVAQEIAQSYNLLFVDQYRLVMEHRDKLRHRDTKHFQIPDYQFMVKDIFDSLQRNGIISFAGQLTDKIPKSTRLQSRSCMSPWWKIKDESRDKLDYSREAVRNEECGLQTSNYWRLHYREMALDVDWLKRKAAFLESGYSAEVNYAFLYVLLRLLEEYKPQRILEFNFGQSTKITAQYTASHTAELTVLEHNRDRVEHYIKCWPLDWTGVVIQGSQLLKVKSTGTIKGWAYGNFAKATEGSRYNLLLIKCPFGGGERLMPHVDPLIKLLDLMADDFAILMDHVEDEEGAKVFSEIGQMLKSGNRAYVCRTFFSTGRQVGLLASASWKYVLEY